jgi:hypothetical protein
VSALSVATQLASGESVKSGPLGLAVILVLCVACYFLFKSMSKHLRKVREEFPTDEPSPQDPTQRPAAGTATGQADQVEQPGQADQPGA